MSGVLKNSLDWGSRPYGRSVLSGKPVLTMTASPAFTGGVRAQQQMNETLVSIPARLVLRPQIVIGGVREKVRDGRLVDEAALRFALAGVDDLLDAEAFGGPQRAAHGVEPGPDGGQGRGRVFRGFQFGPVGGLDPAFDGQRAPVGRGPGPPADEAVPVGHARSADTEDAAHDDLGPLPRHDYRS